jgi:TonB family protein
MNERKLAVTLEIVLNEDGTLDKATIVRPSGVLTFDVAAIDTVQNAGPFENPPEAIRSANGKVYLHWTFHRDERQCSPYFADPFILDNPGTGQERGLPEPASAIAAERAKRRAERISRNASPTEGGVTVPHVTRTEDAEGAAARANVNTPTADDPAAQKAALAWADAFESGSVDKLVAASGVPFSSGGNVVATDPAQLAKVYRAILEETPARRIKDWKLFSAAGYRAVFGRLPKGGEDGTNRLFLAARVGKEWLTLEVAPDGGGQYTVRGDPGRAGRAMMGRG